MRHSSLTPVTAFSTLLLLLLLPSSSPSDFEASIHTISSSSYIKSLCWWGVVTFNGSSNNCEEGPLQQSATPQTYTPEISIGGSSVSNNAQSYYKKLVNANTIPPETNDGNSNQKLVFTNLPAGVQHETTFCEYKVINEQKEYLLLHNAKHFSAGKLVEAHYYCILLLLLLLFLLLTVLMRSYLRGSG